MKNQHTYFKTLLAVLSILLFISCSDEPEIVIPVDDIVGKWTAIAGVTEISYQGMSAYDYWLSQGATPEEAEAQVGYQTRGHGDYVPFSFEFKEDGTYKVILGKVGDTTGVENTGVWELSADRKTLMIDDNESFWPGILQLTAGDFILQFVFDSAEYSQELMTYDITLTYTK